MTADGFPHGERELARDLGLTQKALRVVRSDDLARKADWDVISGEVRYSASGRDRLLEVLKISAPAAAFSIPPILSAAAPAPPGPPEKNSVAPSAAAAPPAPARPLGCIETLTCGKCYSPNRRIVEASTAGGDQVLVRLKDNQNMRPGMAMKCRFAGGRMWELAQRLPRFRGKW